MITEQENGSIKVTIVDFGLVTQYMKKGQHMSEDLKAEYFNGCVIYADTDKLNFFLTSRKDDMLSLFHMLVNILNDDRPYGDKAMIEKLIES